MPLGEISVWTLYMTPMIITTAFQPCESEVNHHSDTEDTLINLPTKTAGGVERRDDLPGTFWWRTYDSTTPAALHLHRCTLTIPSTTKDIPLIRGIGSLTPKQTLRLVSGIRFSECEGGGGGGKQTVGKWEVGFKPKASSSWLCDSKVDSPGVSVLKTFYQPSLLHTESTLINRFSNIHSLKNTKEDLLLYSKWISYIEL